VSFEDNLKTVGLVGENATLAGGEKARAALRPALGLSSRHGRLTFCQLLQDGFTFDRAFSMDTKQMEIYQYGIQETVQGASSVPLPLAFLGSDHPAARREHHMPSRG
jgi:hypothetical protein